MNKRILFSILLSAALFSAFSFAKRDSSEEKRSEDAPQIVHKDHWENI